MQVRWLSIATCFIIISKTHSHRQTLRNIGNPEKNIKDFAKGLTQKESHERCLLEGRGNNEILITVLERKSNVAYSRGNSSQCDISLRILTTDLLRKKNYAIRMVDSWGKLESGILTGNVQWFGRYYECINAEGPQFSGKYFYLMFNDDTVTGYGMCLPSSCTTEEAEEIQYPFPNLLKMNIQAYHPVQPSEYTVVDILAITLASLLGCLVIAGTVYDFHISNGKAEDDERLHIIEDSKLKNKLHKAADGILSFSIIKNTRMIFNTSQKEGDISVLHGLRFFSITWVILGHTFEFGTNFVDNGVDAAYHYITRWSFQAVANATFSVDTFFFVSGLLAAYLGLKEMEKRRGKLNIPLMYVYRYLRLTPAYAFCMLILTSVYSKFGDGPFWPATAELFRFPRETYWWTNLLYINNLYPASLNDECFAWGWYLANDMQFFLFIPFLLYVMYRRPRVGAVILIFIALLSIVATGVISSHYEKQPGVVSFGSFLYSAVQATMYENEDYQLPTMDFSIEAITQASFTNVTTSVPPPDGLSATDAFWSDTYAKPWCRMDVYFIGVLTGLILYSSNTRIYMNKKVVTIGWIASIATSLAIIYGLFGSIKDGQLLPVNVAAFYEAVCRAMWAFCLMWLVVACTFGYGGPINTFLSWKAFIPLSRLTFCTYLIHPAVIYFMYGTMETHLHFSITIISFLYAGIILVSFSCAYVISILIETPVLGLTKAVFGKSQSKDSISAAQGRPTEQNEEHKL